MKFKLTGNELLKDEDYKKLGFRCGLEIHQQLDTKKKLFCHCPVGLVHEEPDAKILRHMRPTLSELGEYDGTALMEFKTKKEVIYQLFRDHTCTYEMDDTPPFPINQEAIDIAIEISLMFNCSIVDEIHIVRKQYLDGSIPTGFQRTAVVGLEGWIPYKDRKIGIRMVTLEEDACREMSDEGHVITWRTDRLSTPLVEVITDPDILTPQEAEEVNWLLGEVLRSTGKVRRGYGSVRQDVNVSITGGQRVEIKGVSKIGYHAALTHNEAFRQKALIKISNQLKKNGYKSPEDFKFNRFDITDKTEWDKIIPNVSNGQSVKAIEAKGITEIINMELQPDWTLANELSGRVRVIACLDNLPNIIHSEQEKGNFVPVETWADIRKESALGSDGTTIIVWGREQDVDTALNEIEDRISQLLTGVLDETRQSLDNGVTDFERILPGPDRMYPDTDSSPTRITTDRVEKIKANLPVSPSVIREYCEKLGIGEKQINYILRKGYGGLFYELAKEKGYDPKLIIHFIKDIAPRLRREGFTIDLSNSEWMEKLFDYISRDNVAISSIMPAVRAYLLGQYDTILEAIEDTGIVTVKDKDISTIYEALQKKNKDMANLQKEKLVGIIMTELRHKYGNNIDVSGALGAINKLT